MRFCQGCDKDNLMPEEGVRLKSMVKGQMCLDFCSMSCLVSWGVERQNTGQVVCG